MRAVLAIGVAIATRPDRARFRQGRIRWIKAINEPQKRLLELLVSSRESSVLKGGISCCPEPPAGPRGREPCRCSSISA